MTVRYEASLIDVKPFKTNVNQGMTQLLRYIVTIKLNVKK